MTMIRASVYSTVIVNNKEPASSSGDAASPGPGHGSVEMRVDVVAKQS